MYGHNLKRLCVFRINSSQGELAPYQDIVPRKHECSVKLTLEMWLQFIVARNLNVSSMSTSYKCCTAFRLLIIGLVLCLQAHTILKEDTIPACILPNSSFKDVLLGFCGKVFLGGGLQQWVL